MANRFDTGNKKVREIVIRKFDFKCAYCGCDLNLKTMHIDHIEPLKRNSNNARVGINSIENYNPSCAPCNISKSDFTIDFWREHIELKLNRIYRDSSTYRLLVRYGLVGTLKQKVIFYFETLK